MKLLPKTDASAPTFYVQSNVQDRDLGGFAQDQQGGTNHFKEARRLARRHVPHEQRKPNGRRPDSAWGMGK